MNVIMLMFDSLNRRYLPSYGCDWTHTPNFQRLAEKTATFDTSYVCSMPCMPARRDLHTGRPNFLHSNWVSLQPWDDSVPAMLKNAGITSHLVSDHYHYLEDGGFNYHTPYSTWQLFRGQEGDPWMGQAAPPEIPENINGKAKYQDWINRPFIRDEADFPQTQTMNAGLDFIRRNHDEDPWFLQIETFDPHEPFCCADKYRKGYKRAGETPVFDWPAYGDVDESPEEIERARHNYAALLSQCDANLGRLLDTMDELEMWDDTMFIVWTDHGYLLGEHKRWAKNIPTTWNEIANTPFFVWDPRTPEAAGTRRSALVQPAIDLGPTLLSVFGLEPTVDMTGKDLTPVIRDDTPVREDAIFGYYGMPVHYTDGRYVYMRAAVDTSSTIPLYDSMPRRFNGEKCPQDWQDVHLETLPFSKGMPVMCRPHTLGSESQTADAQNQLFDVQTDPVQEHPLEDASVEKNIVQRMRTLMQEVQAPQEQFQRYGL